MKCIRSCSPPRFNCRGHALEVSSDELKRLDDYEGDAYMRVSVRLVSKTRAWAYTENPKSSFRIHIEPPDRS